eukprot:TRINITY_DN50377_c0_g1_i1.p1 TRINITY_DN50377_c0_g1~~TRINITY_DN50377_c0_g1_i1.p1  ORF type:complete len:625 (+),score=275.24 TRINITY_DN50377_c0_g1_i1:98-1972(+)
MAQTGNFTGLNPVTAAVAAAASASTPEAVQEAFEPHKTQLQKQIDEATKRLEIAEQKTPIQIKQDEERKELLERRSQLDKRREGLAKREQEMHPELTKVAEREQDVQGRKRKITDQITALQAKIQACERDTEQAHLNGERLLQRERDKNTVLAAKTVRELREGTPVQIPRPPLPPVQTLSPSPPPRWATMPNIRALSLPTRDHHEIMARHPAYKAPPNFRSVTYFWQNWPSNAKIRVPLHENNKLPILTGDDAPEPLKQPDELPVMKADTPHIARVILLNRAEGTDLHPLHSVQMVLAGLHVCPLNDKNECVPQLRQMDVYGGALEEADGLVADDAGLKRAALRNLKRFSGIDLPNDCKLHKFMQVQHQGKDSAVTMRTYFLADCGSIKRPLKICELHREHTVTIEEPVKEEGKAGTEGKDGAKVEKREEKRCGALVKPFAFSLHTLTQPNLVPPQVSFEAKLVAHGLVEMLQNKHTQELQKTLAGLHGQQAKRRKREEGGASPQKADPEATATKDGKAVTTVVRESVVTETVDHAALRCFEFFDIPPAAGRPRINQVRVGDIASSLLSVDGDWTVRRVHELLSAAGLERAEMSRYRAVVTEQDSAFRKTVSTADCPEMILPVA